MKIRQHPRLNDVIVGDEVYSYPHNLFANVSEVFPAAVCVRLGLLSINGTLELISSPQLWRAEDIENLSVCRYCGSRDNVRVEHGTGVPFRVCEHCRNDDDTEPRPLVKPHDVG